MPQYLVGVYHSDDYDPSVETEATIEAIHALNRDLIAAGARKFACGLSPAGFWILEAANMDEALGVGAQGRPRLQGVGRGARDSFPPRSDTRTRRKQVNNLATAASEHAP
jgi:hypothetical protein